MGPPPPPIFLSLNSATLNHYSPTLPPYIFFLLQNLSFHSHFPFPPSQHLSHTVYDKNNHYPFLVTSFPFFLHLFLFVFPTQIPCKAIPFPFSEMKMVKRLCCCGWLVFSSCLLLAALVSSKHHGNPANDLVDIINNNRTAHKLSKLNDSPGLGCMALQYAEFCKGNCSKNGTINCTPSEDDFTEVFAPNCGVELPTFGTITGQIVGCHSKYLEPSLAFQHVLVEDNKALSILRNRSHNEVGVGMVGVHKGPFFWSFLFSSEKTNSTFVLENRGAGIQQKKGCYSGSSIPCSAGRKITADSVTFNYVVITGFFCVHLVQQLQLNLL